MTGERIVIDGGGTVLVLGVADDGRLHQLALGGPEAATVQSAFPVSLHPLVLPTFGEEALREPALRVTSVFPGRIDTEMQRGIFAAEGREYATTGLLTPGTVAAAGERARSTAWSSPSTIFR